MTPALPEEAVKAAQNAIRTTNWEYGITDADMAKALTAALPFLSVQGAVKKLEETLRELITDQSEGEWDEKTIEKDVRKFSARIRSALEPSAARELALEEALSETRTDLVILQGAVAHAARTDSRWEGMYKRVGSWIKRIDAALSSPDHAGAFPQSKNEGRLSELNVEPGEVFERISGHDRHSDNLIGAKYISKDTGPYCQGGLHLERIPSGTGWTTMDDRGIFRRLSCDAGKVEGDGIERAKFYHHQWPMERLLEARRDGLVDHSGGEAWRYEYSHKDEHGKYDILYRPVKNTTIPPRLPSALASEGAE